MTVKKIAGGLLLAPVAAFMLATMPGPVEAGPPFAPPGLADRGGFPPFTPPGVAGGDKIPPFVPRGIPGRGAFPPGPYAGGGGYCPPGLADKGCFPPGAQQFRQGFCPPGLRDKGCMPPGLHRFGRGDYIPDHLRHTRLPFQHYGLPAPGPGRYYAAIGGDVYLVAEATQRVIEAISLFDAAGR